MTTFPRSPRLVKGGLVLLNPDTGAVLRVIALQYNPEKLTRTLQAQVVGEGGDPSQALRLKGPPVETIKLDAEIDAADQLEFPQQNTTTVQHGIVPQLAALETILYPASSDMRANHTLQAGGTLEIAPLEAPLTVFIWGQNRIQPVRLTDLSITEEAFDPSLNPLRAAVSLTLRVLSVTDLGFDHRGGRLFMIYQENIERLAALRPNSPLTTLGIKGIP